MAPDALRDYQHIAVKRTVEASRRGIRAGLFVCPTGGGKTHVFSELARLAHKRGVRTLILSDRLELVEQAAAQVQRLAGLRVAYEQRARKADLQGALRPGWRAVGGAHRGAGRDRRRGVSRKIDHAEARRRAGAQATDQAEAQLVRDFSKAAKKPIRDLPRKRQRRSAWDPEPR